VWEETFAIVGEGEGRRRGEERVEVDERRASGGLSSEGERKGEDQRSEGWRS